MAVLSAAADSVIRPWPTSLAWLGLGGAVGAGSPGRCEVRSDHDAPSSVLRHSLPAPKPDATSGAPKSWQVASQVCGPTQARLQQALRCCKPAVEPASTQPELLTWPKFAARKMPTSVAASTLPPAPVGSNCRSRTDCAVKVVPLEAYFPESTSGESGLQVWPPSSEWSMPGVLTSWKSPRPSNRESGASGFIANDPTESDPIASVIGCQVGPPCAAVAVALNVFQTPPPLTAK